MEQASLTQLFLTLNKQELRELRQFAESPFHNTRPDVVRLLAHLTAGGDGFLQKEAAWDAIAPGKPFDDKGLRYAMSFLQKTILDYLILKELRADEQRNQVHLVRALRKRGLEKAFQKEWSAGFERAERQPFRHIDFFRRKRQLYLEFSESAKRQRRGGDLFFQEMTDALTTHTLAELLRHGCALLAHQSVSGTKYNFALLDAALETAQNQPDWLEIPVVAAYFYVYQSFSGANPVENFRQLKQVLGQNWAIFPQEESRDLYLFAINFCIKKMNSGDKLFIREAFELYKLGLENRLLLENGQLSPYAYNNILLIALALGETGWARQFLDDARLFLPEKERENAYCTTSHSFFSGQKTTRTRWTCSKKRSSASRCASSNRAGCCCGFTTNWAKWRPSTRFWTACGSICTEKTASATIGAAT